MSLFSAEIWRTLLVSLLGLLMAFLTGCAPETTEIERGFNRLADAVETWGGKAIDETSMRTASLQGGAQLIHPGYKMDLIGFFGTGVIIQSDIRLTGVAGQVTAHGQADQGQAATVLPPAVRIEETFNAPVPD